MPISVIFFLRTYQGLVYHRPQGLTRFLRVIVLSLPFLSGCYRYLFRSSVKCQRSFSGESRIRTCIVFSDIHDYLIVHLSQHCPYVLSVHNEKASTNSAISPKFQKTLFLFPKPKQISFGCADRITTTFSANMKTNRY